MSIGKEMYHGLVIQRKGIQYRCEEDSKIGELCENCEFINDDETCKVLDDVRFNCEIYYHFVKVKPKAKK